MSLLKDISSSDVLVQRFTQYLNGPLGRKVLDSLDDGESFIIQTTDYVLRITKQDGRAIVEPVSDAP
ncbi:MAG: hypothetical protein K9W43_01775 [Candidatus Thorarchaeota archaeon]|nr:hypothetical protein [Candidatus Thorarchaeota archaeon]